MTATRQNVCLELLRVSTPKQVELGGLDSQHTDCVTIAKQHGLTLHAEQLRLAGVSGKNVRRTPEIARLDELLRSGRYSGVVMVEDTRLMRANEPEDYALLQVFKDTGAKIYTKTAVYDLSTPEGFMLFQILMAIAARERHVIRARTYSKREKLRTRGLCASAEHTLPEGVMRARFRDGDSDRWAYAWDESRIGAVRRLFDLFVSGLTSFRQLAVDTGISYFKVREILANPIYTGVRTYDERRDPNLDVVDELGRLKYQVKVKRAEDEVERVEMLGADGKPLKPAVPVDVFARAQEMLSLKSEMKWRRNTTEPERYTYRGFLKCAHCGQRLLSVSHRATAGGTVRDYYICRSTHGARRINKDGSTDWYIPQDCESPRIRREQLEPVLDEVITAKLGDPDFLYAVMQSQRKALARGDNKLDIERAKKEVARLEAEQARLNMLFRKGRLDEDEYDSEAAQLDANLAGARKHLTQLVPNVPKVSPEALVRVIAPFERWDLLPADDRRRLLAAVCPLFEIKATGNGGRGAGAKTEVEVVGFWLRLSAGDVDAPDANDGRGGLAVMPKHRAMIEHCQLVSNTALTPKGKTTDQLVYIPLAA